MPQATRVKRAAARNQSSFRRSAASLRMSRLWTSRPSFRNQYARARLGVSLRAICTRSDPAHAVAVVSTFGEQHAAIRGHIDVRDFSPTSSSWQAARADRAGPMTTTRLLIILVPSLVAGLLWGRSLLTGAIWGVAAEVMGLIIVVLPISGGPRNNLSLMMIGVSILLGAFAGALGFALRLLKHSK